VSECANRFPLPHRHHEPHHADFVRWAEQLFGPVGDDVSLLDFVPADSLHGLDRMDKMLEAQGDSAVWRGEIETLIRRVWVEDNGDLTIEGAIPSVIPARPHKGGKLSHPIWRRGARWRCPLPPPPAPRPAR
jgi:hypothetical protein